MSHNIETRTYPENVDRRKVSDILDTYVSQRTIEEGGGGLPSNIRWLEREPICNSESEAEGKIKALDKGWYDCLAVRYYHSKNNGPVSSAALTNACETVNKAQKDYNTLKDTARAEFFNRKSEFVGCKNCGSKLSLIELKRLEKTNCPLCGGNLLSPTITDRLMKAHDKIVKAQKKQAAERAKAEAKRIKADKNREVRWLVKFEYHT